MYLLVEVSGTTLAYDCGIKLAPYAKAGIKEVWIVNLLDEVIEVYELSRGSKYQEAREARRGEMIEVRSVPGLVLGVNDNSSVGGMATTLGHPNSVSQQHLPDFSLYAILSVDNQSSYYQEADHMEAENKALVQHFIEEVWNKGNIDLIDQRVSDSYAGYDPSLPAPINGNEGFKQLVVGFRNAFPDLRLDVEDLVAEGDKVVGRYMLHGTHRGEFLGLPPTGKKLSVTGMFIGRIAGGKYVEGWDLTDALGMMQQLGVIPMPDQSATKPGS